MIIKKISTLTGKEHQVDLPVTKEQLDRYYGGGVLIQDVFPHLSMEEREFIKSGITPKEWNQFFGENPFK